eukprot:GHVS01107583.1.p1 GENE.GHVS01107583.1~~GHVS01107583.1.p1  ORF type:complete len:479 (+),score=103.14 GHVS01107583.1:97-1533(+)
MLNALYHNRIVDKQINNIGINFYCSLNIQTTHNTFLTSKHPLMLQQQNIHNNNNYNNYNKTTATNQQQQHGPYQPASSLSFSPLSPTLAFTADKVVTIKRRRDPNRAQRRRMLRVLLPLREELGMASLRCASDFGNLKMSEYAMDDMSWVCDVGEEIACVCGSNNVLTQTMLGRPVGRVPLERLRKMTKVSATESGRRSYYEFEKTNAVVGLETKTTEQQQQQPITTTKLITPENEKLYESKIPKTSLTTVSSITNGLDSSGSWNSSRVRTTVASSRHNGYDPLLYVQRMDKYCSEFAHQCEYLFVDPFNFHTLCNFQIPNNNNTATTTAGFSSNVRLQDISQVSVSSLTSASIRLHDVSLTPQVVECLSKRWKTTPLQDEGDGSFTGVVTIDNSQRHWEGLSGTKRRLTGMSNKAKFRLRQEAVKACHRAKACRRFSRIEFRQEENAMKEIVDRRVAEVDALCANKMKHLHTNNKRT